MDKAVKVGTLHGNTGARRKSVLQGERRLLKSTTVDQLQMQPRRGSMLRKLLFFLGSEPKLLFVTHFQFSRLNGLSFNTSEDVVLL
ncbi:hypothetical protein Gohar_001246, partial [Gossypium harknessii]|nr:hypothetical protein [Gossypium harknessii]